MVAESAGQVIGHILFSKLRIMTAERTIEALALAPLSVLPAGQRQGVGSRLVREGLHACGALGHRIVIVLGHPEFYPRFGFSAGLAQRLTAPFSGPAFMALELDPAALHGISGRVAYPPPFGLCESDFAQPPDYHR
jgi:putative acetyltransferase